MPSLLIITYLIIYIFSQLIFIAVPDGSLLGSFVEVYASSSIEPSEENPDDSENDDSGILASIKDMILGLFIPSEGFYEEKLNKLDAKVKAKLPFQVYVDTIGRLKNISSSLNGDASALNITYDYKGEFYTLEIGTYIAPHLSKIRSLITGLYIFFILYYNYRQILFLVRASDIPRTHIE